MIESTPSSPVSKGKLTSHTLGDEAVPFDRYATTARNGAGGLMVSINTLYLAGAAIVVVALLIWVGGYFYGMRSKQKELEPVLRQSVIPSGGDPLATNSNPNPPASLGTVSQPTFEATLSSKAAPGNGNAGASPGSIISARGLLASDPREPGLNYLHIERLPAGDAEKVIAFLTRSGVETIGVPVEPSKKGANNVPLYSVVALRGITGEQYRQKDKARSGLESEVVRLGTIWQREYKGTTNFTRSNWMKYQP